MELHEFLEQFLPDYDAKFNIAYENQHKTENADRDFKDKHFPEAFQNFEDKICEKQRIYAIKAFFEQGGNMPMEVPSIKQPNPEEL